MRESLTVAGKQNGLRAVDAEKLGTAEKATNVPSQAKSITRAVLYSRINPIHGPDSETQLRELREYAACRDWMVVKEYIDRGGAGPKASRPALRRLMRDACGGAFDTVLVWKLDRFGRSLRHLIRAMMDLTACGISFASLQDGLKLGAGKTLDARILGALAEFEVSRTQERVKVGLRRAKNKGRVGGRRRVVVDSSQVLAMRESGASWRAIAQSLGVGLGTVHRIAAARSKNVCG
jgi:DNA invertase Pin-like site-specific DNA recombinase